MKLDRILSVVVVATLASTSVMAQKSGFRKSAAPVEVGGAKDVVVSPEVRDAIGRRIGNVDALNEALKGKELTERNIHDAAMRIVLPEGFRDAMRDQMKLNLVTTSVREAFSNPTSFVEASSARALAESVANGPRVCQTRQDLTSGDALAKIKDGQGQLAEVVEINKGLPKGSELIADEMVGDAALLAAEGDAEAAGVRVHNETVFAAAKEVRAAQKSGKCEGACTKMDLNGDGQVSTKEGQIYIDGKVHDMFETAFLGSRDEEGKVCDAACARKVADEWKERKCIRVAA